MVTATMITKLDSTDSASLKPTAMLLWKGAKTSPREAGSLTEPNRVQLGGEAGHGAPGEGFIAGFAGKFQNHVVFEFHLHRLLDLHQLVDAGGPEDLHGLLPQTGQKEPPLDLGHTAHGVDDHGDA